MATFSYSPDFGASKQSAPVVRKAQFADGYVQRAIFGINALKETWAVNFTNRDLTEANGIEAFLSAHVTDSFDWTPPGETTSQKFTVASWTKATPYANLYSLSASFERSYDP